jgi:3-oxoacyl-[acyl-carrier-protein] synthase II
MRAALAEGGLFAPEVDFISASANGSRLADKNEALAIKAVFNGHALGSPIVAIKSMIGETLGASGVVQAIDAIESLRTGTLPGIAGLDDADPELPALDLCTKTRNLRARSSLINSVGFDGQACSLLICTP